MECVIGRQRSAADGAVPVPAGQERLQLPDDPKRVRLPPGWRTPLSLQGQERLRDGDEGDVVVPAGVGAAFEVVEAECVFEFAVVVLDPPAHLGQADQRREVGVGGEIG